MEPSTEKADLLRRSTRKRHLDDEHDGSTVPVISDTPIGRADGIPMGEGLLQRRVSLRVLQSRAKELWKFQHDCEITNLEVGYFVVRFFDRTNHYHVLEHSPWNILGHYLMVFQWKPNFCPKLEKMHSTMVWARSLASWLNSIMMKYL
ncbi:hypothetical protein M9H77_19553 [Catharanthus roseus]|uniref:Uncharacterized protein n=1 Tax=Catharanthus roseus TaxID=4058 RepID=A0ACC0BAQ2_CATRO|nr:hypothetical protein M9H77_19553 [Catharanthus roseus]